MLWLALVFPEWPLQARFRAQAHTQPLAVAAKQRVVALDATALAQGVRPGQRVADALALAPDLLISPRDSRVEDAALKDAAGCALHFTPHVALATDGLLLEIAGSIRLFGGLDGLLRALRSALAAAGFHALSACAPTPRAARWLALGTPGRTIRSPGALLAALAALPLDVTEAGEARLATLREAGLRSVGDAMKLPRDALALRDAQALRRLIDQALGQTADPRMFFSPPPEIDSRIELPVPRHDADVLLFAASRLFNSACTQLAAAHAGIAECLLELQHEHEAPTRLELRTGTPTHDARLLASLTREHLARITLPEAVTALRLRAPDWIEQPGRSRDLFGTQAPSPQDRQEARDVLVERLRARLGRDAVYSLSASGDHRPERAQQRDEPGRAQPAAGKPQRPLWLLPEPELLAERDGQPWRNGPLHCLGRAERIEAGWWDDAGGNDHPAEALRDYYIAVGPRQERLWIYREHRAPHRWYLQGLFA